MSESVESRWSWSKSNVDYDTVRVALHAVQAQAVESAAVQERYQVGECTVDIDVKLGQPLLTIEGPSEASVRDGARRLAYNDADGIVREVPVSSPQRAAPANVTSSKAGAS
ncbi:hypothetical protein [Amycolatopsis sp. NPDC058986]|uniref:hypothetical protein n=1 Tax=unclassified Amycolatopsis TaxID=2618356 RepID=UPI00367292D3